jgi:hypothetical protein
MKTKKPWGSRTHGLVYRFVRSQVIQDAHCPYVTLGAMSVILVISFSLLIGQSPASITEAAELSIKRRITSDH